MLDRAQKRGRCSDLISRVSTLNLEFNRWLAAVIYLLQGSTTEVWANNGDERISFHPQKKKSLTFDVPWTHAKKEQDTTSSCYSMFVIVNRGRHEKEKERKG